MGQKTFSFCQSNLSISQPMSMGKIFDLGSIYEHGLVKALSLCQSMNTGGRRLIGRVLDSTQEDPSLFNRKIVDGT